jgi:hypothetical protein
MWRESCDRESVAPLLQKLVALSALLMAVGCAKAAKPAAAPEADYDWSQYNGGKEAPGSGTADKGDSAPKSDGSAANSDSSKPSKAVKPEAVAAAPESSTDDSPKPGKPDLSASSKKASKAKIKGESVSLVSASSLAGASKTALKSKVVSSNVIMGPEYEMVQIVLKDASVQIVRPATTPDQAGPKLRSPKARNDSLSSNESGYYDPDADVLVLVQSNKAAKSKKALGALLKK